MISKIYSGEGSDIDVMRAEFSNKLCCKKMVSNPRGFSDTQPISVLSATSRHRFSFYTGTDFALRPLPRVKHVRKQKRIGLLRTKYGFAPAVDNVFVHRGEPMVVPLMDIRKGDSLFGNFNYKPELDGDNVPPVEIDNPTGKTLLIDILQVYIIKADILKTYIPNRVAVLHSSGFFVAC